MYQFLFPVDSNVLMNNTKNKIASNSFHMMIKSQITNLENMHPPKILNHMIYSNIL